MAITPHDIMSSVRAVNSVQWKFIRLFTTVSNLLVEFRKVCELNPTFSPLFLPSFPPLSSSSLPPSLYIHTSYLNCSSAFTLDVLTSKKVNRSTYRNNNTYINPQYITEVPVKMDDVMLMSPCCRRRCCFRLGSSRCWCFRLSYVWCLSPYQL